MIRRMLTFVLPASLFSATLLIPRDMREWPHRTVVAEIRSALRPAPKPFVFPPPVIHHATQSIPEPPTLPPVKPLFETQKFDIELKPQKPL